MDQFLADFYGTGYANEEDVYMDKLAAEQSESDFLGRVMAHSFHQELELIKEAYATPQRLADEGLRQQNPYTVARGLQKRRKARVVLSPAQKEAKRQAALYADESGQAGARRGTSKGYKAPAAAAPAEVGRMRRLWQAATKTRGRQAALAAGGAALAAGAGYGTHRALRGKKKASADEEFAALVEQRAYEHLDAAGLLEKEAADDDFDTMVDRAALELLEANGYPVEWY